MAKRGRPTLRGEIHPHFKQRAAIRALKDVRSKKKWTVADCVEALAAAESEIRVKHKEACESYHPNFSADDNVMSRCLRDGYIPYRQLINAIILWMQHEFRSEYQRMEDDERVRDAETDVIAVQKLLAHRGENDFELVAQLAGSYNLYRPCHLRPLDEITVATFTIGNSAIEGSLGSEFDCSLVSQYHEDGGISWTRAVGKIVPHNSHLLAIMTTKSGGNFIFLFDELHASPDTQQIDGLGGIVLASATRRSSAWPICAIRRKKTERMSHSYPASEVRNLPYDVWERLRRGAIYWRDETFPGFGGGDQKSYGWQKSVTFRYEGILARPTDKAEL
jgi:hypothetical protein